MATAKFVEVRNASVALQKLKGKLTGTLECNATVCSGGAYLHLSDTKTAFKNGKYNRDNVKQISLSQNDVEILKGLLIGIEEKFEEMIIGAKKVSKPALNKMMATPPQTQQTEGPQYPQNSALVTTYCPPNAFAQMATSPQSQQIGGPQNNTLPTNAMQNSQMQGQQNIMTAYGPPNAFAQGAIEYPSNNVQMASAPQSQQRGGPQNNTLPANAMQNAHMLGPQNIMTAYGPSNAFGAVEYPANSVQMANSPQSQQIGGPQNNTLPANVMQNAQMQGPHNLMTAYGSPNAFAQGAALFDTDY